jgi:predicted RNA-binding protein Jag
MESIAFIANRKFLLIAIDRNLAVRKGEEILDVTNASKIAVFHQFIALAAIGEFYKVSDIYNFTWKLNELGNNETFDELVEDVKSTFGTSESLKSYDIPDLNELYLKFTNEKGIIDSEALLEHVKNDEKLYPFIKESLYNLQNGFNPTTLFVFGANPNLQVIKIGKYKALGNSLEGKELNLNENKNIICIASSMIDESIIQQMELNATIDFEESLKKFVHEIETENLIIEGKKILTEIIKKITPFEKTPNVEFYEVNKKTNFEFKDPVIKLIRYNFER